MSREQIDRIRASLPTAAELRAGSTQAAWWSFAGLLASLGAAIGGALAGSQPALWGRLSHREARRGTVSAAAARPSLCLAWSRRSSRPLPDPEELATKRSLASQGAATPLVGGGRDICNIHAAWSSARAIAVGEHHGRLGENRPGRRPRPVGGLGLPHRRGRPGDAGRPPRRRGAARDPPRLRRSPAGAAIAASPSPCARRATTRELAVGFLFTEGIIASPEQVAGVHCLQEGQRGAGSTCGRASAVDLARLERHFYTASSCGVCGKTSLAAVRVPPAGRAAARPARRWTRRSIHRLPRRPAGGPGRLRPHRRPARGGAVRRRAAGCSASARTWAGTTPSTSSSGPSSSPADCR